jgi:ketosteroid isomerase-like protein
MRSLIDVLVHGGINQAHRMFWSREKGMKRGRAWQKRGFSMTFQGVARFAAITIFLILFVSVQAQPKTIVDDQTENDRSEVLKAVRAFFNALEAGNNTQFMSIVTPDFYSFEGGTRISGGEILSFIKAQRTAGRSYGWNVSKADVHVIGDTASVAYVNQGSITDSSGTTDQKWLESAFLERQGAGWKIAFLHSTRVPKPTQNATEN